jgi:hypothetical protein
MYRWLSIAVQRNGSDVVVWINGARAYEGPAGTAVIWNATQSGNMVAQTNGTVIGYNVTVALPNCPVVVIYDTPWPSVSFSQVWYALKDNGYNPEDPKNSACYSSLANWYNNGAWATPYIYAKPIAVAELVQTPQGLYLGIGNGTLYVVYKKEYFTPDSNGQLSYVGSNYTIAAAAVRMLAGSYPKTVPLSIPLNSSWSGWAYLQNVQFPSGSFSASNTVYVMPAGPWFGNQTSGGWKYYMLGVIPPLQGYNLHLFENASGLVAQWDDPSCGMGCIRTEVMSSPGIYNIDFYPASSGLPTINGMTLYVDPQIAIAMHLYYELDNRGYTDKAFAVVDWYSPYTNVVYSSISGSWGYHVGSGPLGCFESSSGDLPTWAGGHSNTAFMASIDGGWWEVDCYYPYSNTPAFSYRVVFQGSNIYVYRNGQLVRQLSVSYTYTPTAWNPVPALNAPLEPAIYWDGRTYAAAYTGTGYTSPADLVSYGHIYYAFNSTPVPAMYIYNTTGAYPYQLTVNVEAVPVWATTYSPNNIDYYTYANYSYAGYLRLALGGNTTSYDAMYGWGIVLVATQQVRVNTGRAPGAPEGVCVPTVTITPEGEAHMNLQNYTNGYSVTVAKNYTVTVTGCGYNETYIMLVQVASYTVNGHDYHVIDPYGRTCGYNEAYLNKTNGLVYCNNTKTSP